MVEIKQINEIIAGISSCYKKKPVVEYNLVYDTTTQTLEPIYFWILDLTNSLFGGDVEKLVDNFTSTPGSGHFAELGARATRMQDEAMKILGHVNTVIKSMINIIYDLKEFQIRLKHYEAAKSKEKEEAEAGLLALKQIWMDNVDVKRGRGSINMLAQDLNFITIRDAFMAADSVERVDKLDLNDRVKRILKPRVKEFFEWKNRSEKEIKKRYEVERTYLKSQINALQLYTRWVKPYLKVASQLTMKEKMREPALVNIFNTILLELAIMAKAKVDVKEAAIDKNLPEAFAKTKMKRDYYSVVLINFKFRGIPQRIAQQAHYAFGGRADVTFRAYALNQDELDLLEEELKKSDLQEALQLVEGTTTESLDQLREDIEYFLKEETEQEKIAKGEKIKGKEDINPFAALLGRYNKPKKEKKTKEEKQKQKKQQQIKSLKKKGVKKDDFVEKAVREFAENGAKERCFDIYDIFKKAHDMAAFP